MLQIVTRLVDPVVQTAGNAIILELANDFQCTPDALVVFHHAFAWYFVPTNYQDKGYPTRVIAAAVVAFDKQAEIPDWVQRVYEKRIHRKRFDAGTWPPSDPKTGASPRF